MVLVNVTGASFCSERSNEIKHPTGGVDGIVTVLPSSISSMARVSSLELGAERLTPGAN